MNLQQVNVPSPQALINSLLNQPESVLQQLDRHFRKVYPSESPTKNEYKKPSNNGGGSDPLRYIYIYRNKGDPNSKIPKHWHYVGLGLSDIHDYKWFSQVHEWIRNCDSKYASETQKLPELYPEPMNLELNGFGFELTFRLRCNSEDDWNNDPPAWPIKIMQGLARYVFQTSNTFYVGDHAAWHGPLDSDGQDEESSRVKHLLMTLDPQLGYFLPGANSKTKGPVTFIQMVGVCDEELQAAREWNVGGILEIMREREETGGDYLVTDMRRGETIFEMDPDISKRVEMGITSTGSNMAKVTVKHKTHYQKPSWFVDTTDQQEQDEAQDMNFELAVEDDDECAMNTDDATSNYPTRTPSRMSQGSEAAFNPEHFNPEDVRYYQRIYILLSEESARFLPIMLKGRLAHQRPFTFQNFKGGATTFKPEGSDIESMVCPERPFAEWNRWLQIYVPSELCEQMWEAVKEDFSKPNRCPTVDEENDERVTLPKHYSWPKYNLYLTVVKEL